jgi:hypothetical protein
MPTQGCVWQAPANIRDVKPRKWSDSEKAALARAFIDLDLDGPDLYRWCKANGIDRQPAAIDAQIARMDFFDNDVAKQKATEWVKKRYHLAGSRLTHPGNAPAYLEAARKELANQIRLAKLEAPFAPLYRPAKEDI